MRSSVVVVVVMAADHAREQSERQAPVKGRNTLYATDDSRHEEVRMPVIALFRWRGDPGHLLATYDRELQHPIAREQPRRIAHTCAGTGDGMVIIDVWESEGDFRTMMDDPEFQQNLKDSGTPEPHLLEVWPVHALIPDPEGNRRLVSRYFDFLNERDPSIAEEILSLDVVFFGPRAPQGVRGRDAFTEFVRALRRDSPDLRFLEGETVTEGNQVASVFTMKRTHRTQEGGAKVLETQGVDLFLIKDGRIRQINAYFDRLSLLVETGVIPPPLQAS
jgi:ketosteroid isomerase-like protein